MHAWRMCGPSVSAFTCSSSVPPPPPPSSPCDTLPYIVLRGSASYAHLCNTPSPSHIHTRPYLPPCNTVPFIVPQESASHVHLFSSLPIHHLPTPATPFHFLFAWGLGSIFADTPPPPPSPQTYKPTSHLCNTLPSIVPQGSALHVPSLPAHPPPPAPSTMVQTPFTPLQYPHIYCPPGSSSHVSSLLHPSPHISMVPLSNPGTPSRWSLEDIYPLISEDGHPFPLFPPLVPLHA
jgi:hypothetical protein